MKTTLHLSDELLERAKATALKRRRTLRALVERGFERELSAVSEEELEGILTRLRDEHPGLWKDVNADTYVKEQRSGWSE